MDYGKVTIICPIFNSYPYIIHSLQAQTYKNWELILVHDGPGNLRGDLKLIGESRVTYLETKERSGNWGHKIRSEQIQNLPDSGFVLITNPDNYHVPIYLEKMLQGFVNDSIRATYCSQMVHSYVDWKILECSISRLTLKCVDSLFLHMDYSIPQLSYCNLLILLAELYIKIRRTVGTENLYRLTKTPYRLIP